MEEKEMQQKLAALESVFGLAADSVVKGNDPMQRPSELKRLLIFQEEIAKALKEHWGGECEKCEKCEKKVKDINAK